MVQGTCDRHVNNRVTRVPIVGRSKGIILRSPVSTCRVLSLAGAQAEEGIGQPFDTSSAGGPASVPLRACVGALLLVLSLRRALVPVPGPSPRPSKQAFSMCLCAHAEATKRAKVWQMLMMTMTMMLAYVGGDAGDNPRDVANTSDFSLCKKGPTESCRPQQNHHLRTWRQSIRGRAS